LATAVSPKTMNHMNEQLASKASTRDRRRTALIAEPDRFEMEMLNELLSEEQWHVVMTPDAREACHYLEQASFTLALISSFSMSSQDPAQWSALREIVAAANRTPVLFLTGHIVDETDIHRLGLAGVVRKPYDIASLLAAIDLVASQALREA